MNTSDSENNEEYILPDVLESDQINSLKSLPEKSRKQYEAVYKAFMDWRSLNKVDSFSENDLLAYFVEVSVKYKASSLWSQWSMLRSTLKINHNVNIENYSKLRALLKHKGVGYQAKKAKMFTTNDIERFINEAPDNKYLATKVALIMGMTGACRATELHSMTIDNIQDLGSVMLVSVPITKTKLVRKFTITNNFYSICKKYAGLRPSNCTCTSFFLNYLNGKCTPEKIGINKFGAMGKLVATFLKLSNPEMYTAHSYRRQSSNLVVNSGQDVSALKKEEEWQYTSVADESIDVSMNDKMETAKKITDQNGSTYTFTTSENMNSTPYIHFENCSNITINFITKSEK